MRTYELTCFHGIGHSAGIHGCDGCCNLLVGPATDRELERILKILRSFAEHLDLCEQGCYPEDCSAPMFEVAIQEILGTGFQKNVNNDGHKGA